MADKETNSKTLPALPTLDYCDKENEILPIINVNGEYVDETSIKQILDYFQLKIASYTNVKSNYNYFPKNIFKSPKMYLSININNDTSSWRCVIQLFDIQDNPVFVIPYSDKSIISGFNGNKLRLVHTSNSRYLSYGVSLLNLNFNTLKMVKRGQQYKNLMICIRICLTNRKDNQLIIIESPMMGMYALLRSIRQPKGCDPVKRYKCPLTNQFIPVKMPLQVKHKYPLPPSSKRTPIQQAPLCVPIETTVTQLFKKHDVDTCNDNSDNLSTSDSSYCSTDLDDNNSTCSIGIDDILNVVLDAKS
jgi:hypothetical protein